MSDDAQLIGRARSGELDAFERIVLAHQGAVRVYLSRFIPSSDRVDDVAQETFLAAYRRLSSFQGRSSLRVWLIGIARLEAIDHLRSASRRRRREDAGYRAALARFHAQRLENESESKGAQRLDALRTCVDKLPPRMSSALERYYFARQPVSEIAREVGKTTGAVDTLLTRIRDALRECIERLAAEEEAS